MFSFHLVLGDDVDLRVPRASHRILNWHHFRDRDVSPGRDIRPDGGDDGIRTHDPLLAGQVLSQLSYTPILWVVCFSPFFRFGEGV